MSLTELLDSLDRRLHQRFQHLLIHIVQGLDVLASHSGGELAKFFAPAFPLVMLTAKADNARIPYLRRSPGF